MTGHVIPKSKWLSILALLDYSWADKNYEYDSLTDAEKTRIARKEFDELVQEIGHGK